MSDGTDAGGITRSAFYLYFRDKHELLTAAAVGTAQALYDEADRWCTAAAVPSGPGRGARRGRRGCTNGTPACCAPSPSSRATTRESARLARGRGTLRRRDDRAPAHRAARRPRAGRAPRELEPQATAETLVWTVERCCYVYLARGERSRPELVDALTATWCAVLYPAALRHPRSSAA